jgi:type I restriction enzyme S subunit
LVHKDILKHINGGTRAKLNQSDMRDIKFLRPPLLEQQKIAAILTSVDEVIEKTQAQIDKLKDLKTAMMQTLLTNGVGTKQASADAALNNSTACRESYIPHTEFKDSPVGRIPKSWEVKPLNSVVHKIIDCEHKTAPYVDKSEYLVVRTSNVRHGELVLDDMKYTHANGYAEWTKRAIPSLGDVLFTREAPAGESCLMPENTKVCMGQRMVLLRPDTNVILPNFFSLFLTSEVAALAIYSLSIGTTVSRINIEDIKRIPCVVPPLSEQQEISNAIQSVQFSMLKKQKKLSTLYNTKKALMQDLLTGKVRVKVD